MSRRRASVLSMLVAPLLLMMGLTVSSAQASATNIINIPSELDACKGVAQNVGLTKHEGGFNAGVYNTFGKSYPVILVHGLNGKNMGQWGDLDQSTDLAARIDSVSNAVVATEFQYDTVGDRNGYGDVTFKDHLQPLANAIDCIAQISARNGGPGKVIVVGYSEGSALAHGAAAKKSANGQRSIGDEIGQAVTVADARTSHPFPFPLQGLAWKGFYTPDFPSNVTVHSIGGNAINTVKASDGSYAYQQVTHSDGLVYTSDAISQSTNDAGGGTHITSCFRIYPAHIEVYGVPVYLGTPNSPPCQHGNLLRDSPETQWDIVDAITAFVNAHCTGAESSGNPMNATPTVDPTPPPSPTNTSTPGGPPTVDPTGQPTPAPTSPPGGCAD